MNFDESVIITIQLNTKPIAHQSNYVRAKRMTTDITFGQCDVSLILQYFGWWWGFFICMPFGHVNGMLNRCRNVRIPWTLLWNCLVPYSSILPPTHIFMGIHYSNGRVERWIQQNTTRYNHTCLLACTQTQIHNYIAIIWQAIAIVIWCVWESLSVSHGKTKTFEPYIP